MVRYLGLLTVSLAAAGACASSAQANTHETKTVELATQTVRAMGALALKGIPPALWREAAGIAIIPHVVKAGLIVDERYGQGVVLVRNPDGAWSHPVFVTLTGHGVGLEAGVASTDLVLVFRTKRSLERALRGKLTLGTDANVAVGLLGHEVERATDSPWLRADIVSYSHSRGLFAGVSLEGSVLHVNGTANDSFYGVRGCKPDDVLARRGQAAPPVELLHSELVRIGGGAVAPAAVVAPARRR
jgi:lipid-binding SYLF domain-containing protein